MNALTNACIYDFHNFKNNRYIIFDSEIREIGNMEDFKGAENIIDCSGNIVLPGLVNCHTHIYSTFSRGMNVYFDPKNFKDILKQLWWRLDGQLDNTSTYYSGLIYGIDCVKNGVTTIVDHHASGLSINGSLMELKKAICDEIGLRGIFCFETSDRFDVSECIKENLSISKVRNEKCAGLFGMHASMTVSDESLEIISKNTKGLPIHIHVAESKYDEEDCRNKYNKSVVERLSSFNLLNKDSILAHCVHINENEADIIKQSDSIIAINPTSNMNNAVGLADYNLFKKYKLKCMIGNDGLGANIIREYLNIVFGMKNRLGSPTSFGLDELVQMIENGYEYISRVLNIRVGRIKEGYKADMITIPYNPPTPMNNGNVLGHLFYGIFDNFKPKDVWVDGKGLVRNYELKMDTLDIYKEARKEAEKVWTRMH